MNSKPHKQKTKNKISRSMRQAHKREPHARSKAVEHIPSGKQYPSGKQAAQAHGVSEFKVNHHCRMGVEQPEFQYVNYKPVKYYVDRKGRRHRTLQEAADANGCSVTTVKYHVDGKSPVTKRRFRIEYDIVEK